MTTSYINNLCKSSMLHAETHSKSAKSKGVKKSGKKLRGKIEAFVRARPEEEKTRDGMKSEKRKGNNVKDDKNVDLVNHVKNEKATDNEEQQNSKRRDNQAKTGAKAHDSEHKGAHDITNVNINDVGSNSMKEVKNGEQEVADVIKTKGTTAEAVSSTCLNTTTSPERNDEKDKPENDEDEKDEKPSRLKLLWLLSLPGFLGLCIAILLIWRKSKYWYTAEGVIARMSNKSTHSIKLKHFK